MDFVDKLNGKEYEWGATSIVFASSKTFKKFQLGFRTNGESKDNLINNSKESWKETWYVIAKETLLGDPYFIDIADNKIYYVGYDCDYDCDVSKIADSIDSFIKMCEILEKNFKNINNESSLNDKMKLLSNTLNEISKIDESINIDFLEDLFIGWFID